MKQKSLLTKVLSSIQKLFSPKHNWVQVSSYVSSNKGYAHEHYHCDCCDSTKHVMKYWNKKPITKILKNHEK